MHDAARSGDNVVDEFLKADVPDAEGSTALLDFLATGVKLRSISSTHNTSGARYVFIAFAEQGNGGNIPPANAR